MAKDKNAKKTQNKNVLENNAKEKKNYDKVNSVMKNIDDNRVSIILFVVGFLVATLLFRCILWPDRIATLKDGTQPVATLTDKTITADDLYEDMKKQYSVNILLNKIDDTILSKLYEENKDMNDEVTNTAESYYQFYEKNYGYTKEQFLSENGITEKEFLESLVGIYS